MAQIVIEKIIQDDDEAEIEQEEKEQIQEKEFDGKIIDLDLDEILEKENE